MTDSYKHSHFKMLPPGTTNTYFYIESRGGEHDSTVMFGIEHFREKYLSVPLTPENIEEAAELCEAHGIPFNQNAWDIILEQYDGYLPIAIHSVPEGSIIPLGHPLVTVENLDDRFPWLPGFIETALLRSVWYGTTVATEGYFIKKNILSYLEETGTPEDIGFKLHDFGARGVSSKESAELGGMAHLVNFEGTDTLEAVAAIQEVYSDPNFVAGFSIPATEHSTICSWGRDGELAAYGNLVDQFKGQMFACVSDSYDIWAAMSMWKALEPKIIENGCTVVIRPDSGDPLTIVAGEDTRFTLDDQGVFATPEFLGVVEYAMELFGWTVNSKGFKVLPDHIRVIQGDGVDAASIDSILFRLYSKGISADNIAFGRGGAGLQKVNRDTFKFAMKCSAIKINDVWKDVYKDPITDKGKQSKKGLVTTFISDGKPVVGRYDARTGETMINDVRVAPLPSALKLIYHLGDDAFSTNAFSTIRRRVAQ